jgi:sulfur carrier protein
MIRIRFNDQLVTLASPLNLSQFLIMHTKQNGCYAVALNRQFIAESNYSTKLLQEGDHVELITPMQGG